MSQEGTVFTFPSTAARIPLPSSPQLEMREVVVDCVAPDDTTRLESPYMKHPPSTAVGRFGFWLSYLAITATMGLASCFAIAYTNDYWSTYQQKDWISLICSFSPLIGLEIALGIPTLWQSFKANFVGCGSSCLLPWVLMIGVAWASSTVLYDAFNPLTFCFILASSIGVLGSLQMVGQAIGMPNRFGVVFTGGLTFVDVALWCLLFVPLDYRWYNIFYWSGPAGMSYDWWAVAITVLGIIGWGLLRDLPGFGYRLVPTFKDVYIGVGALLALAAVVVPLGLLTGFLQWPPAEIPTFWQVFTLWWENVLTIAITEELFFRVVVMNGLNMTVKNNWNEWFGLIASSLWFGLMHWPRRQGHLTQQILYASLAFVSGILYGKAYMLSDNNILAPVLTHSLTDTAWAFLFKG